MSLGSVYRETSIREERWRWADGGETQRPRQSISFASLRRVTCRQKLHFQWLNSPKIFHLSVSRPPTCPAHSAVSVSPLLSGLHQTSSDKIIIALLMSSSTLPLSLFLLLWWRTKKSRTLICFHTAWAVCQFIGVLLNCLSARLLNLDARNVWTSSLTCIYLVEWII